MHFLVHLFKWPVRSYGDVAYRLQRLRLLSDLVHGVFSLVTVRTTCCDSLSPHHVRCAQSAPWYSWTQRQGTYCWMFFVYRSAVSLACQSEQFSLQEKAEDEEKQRHAYICIRICTCISVCVCVCVCVCICMCIHIYTHVWYMYMHMYLHTYLYNMHVHMYLYLYMCMYIYMCMYVCFLGLVYTYTHASMRKVRRS